MIFDCHVHIGKKKFIGKIKSENRDLPGYNVVMENTWEKYIKIALRNNIFKALIFPFPLEEVDIYQANNYISAAYEVNRELFIHFFLLNERIDIDELERNEIFGLKEHFYISRNSDIKTYFHIYQYLQDKGKFLYIHPHMSERIERVRLIKNNFPALKIILAHSGRKWPFTGDEVLDLVIPALKSYKDIYFDTSTISDSKVISKMINILGGHRVLFGSDYPFSQPSLDVYQSEFNIIDKLDVTDEDRENILHNNFRRLFLKDVWIRRVAREDRAKLLGIFTEISAQERKFLALDQKLELIKSNIRDERHIYIAEDNKNIVGYIRESGRANQGAIIEEILIPPDYRGKGYADLLIKAVSNKFKYVEAKTFMDNITANALNVKLGFDIVKQSNNGKILYWRKMNDKPIKK